MLHRDPFTTVMQITVAPPAKPHASNDNDNGSKSKVLFCKYDSYRFQQYGRDRSGTFECLASLGEFMTCKYHRCFKPAGVYLRLIHESLGNNLASKP